MADEVSAIHLLNVSYRPVWPRQMLAGGRQFVKKRLASSICTVFEATKGKEVAKDSAVPSFIYLVGPCLKGIPPQ